MTNHNTDKRLSHFTTLKWHEYVKKLDKTFLIHKGKAILYKKKKKVTQSCEGSILKRTG